MEISISLENSKRYDQKAKQAIKDFKRTSDGRYIKAYAKNRMLTEMWLEIYNLINNGNKSQPKQTWGEYFLGDEYTGGNDYYDNGEFTI